MLVEYCECFLVLRVRVDGGSINRKYGEREHTINVLRITERDLRTFYYTIWVGRDACGGARSACFVPLRPDNVFKSVPVVFAIQVESSWAFQPLSLIHI